MRGETPFSIPVCRTGKQVASLEPVTRRTLSDRNLLESMARWRNGAVDSFLTQFEATPDNVRRWLEDSVLGDPTRLILQIAFEGRSLGTLGFFNLTPASAVLDRLILGERGGPPALIIWCEQALIRWLFDAFDLERVEAIVLAHNFPALRLQQAVGFQIEDKVPLRRVEGREGTSWIECAPHEAETAKYRLALSREQFEEETDNDDQRPRGSDPACRGGDE